MPQRKKEGMMLHRNTVCIATLAVLVLANGPRAWAQHKGKHPQGSEESFDAASEGIEIHVDELGSYMDRVRAGEADAAIRALQDAIKRNASDVAAAAELKLALGMVCLRSGDTVRTRGVLKGLLHDKDVDKGVAARAKLMLSIDSPQSTKLASPAAWTDALVKAADATAVDVNRRCATLLDDVKHEKWTGIGTRINELNDTLDQVWEIKVSEAKAKRDAIARKALETLGNGVRKVNEFRHDLDSRSKQLWDETHPKKRRKKHADATASQKETYNNMRALHQTLGEICQFMVSMYQEVRRKSGASVPLDKSVKVEKPKAGMRGLPAHMS